MKWYCFLYLPLVIGWHLSTAQAPCFQDINKNDRAGVMFYNVENLFDTITSEFTRDEEFTPAGDKNWNGYRFRKKLNNIYKVIIASGKWNPPVLVGLAEVENQFVLDELIRYTPLGDLGYSYCHYESPDERGIDVALLYRKGFCKLIYSRGIPVIFPDDTLDRTRDILMAKLKVFNDNYLYVFVNHWPSRSGGMASTNEKRKCTSKLLSQLVDSILLADCNSNIIIMGDLNDDPDNESVSQLVGNTYTNGKCAIKLENLMLGFNRNITGTLKYNGNWFLFDQVIVSSNLVSGVNGLQIYKESVKIIMEDFMIAPDEKNLGIMPFRTYSGPRYLGGYSDHFPVYFEITKLQ